LKKYGLVAGGILITLLVAGIFATSGVFAQGSTTQTPTETPSTIDRPAFGPGMGRGHGGGLDATALDAAAQALGLTTDELSTKLQDGMTLAEIASEAGVDEQVVKDAIEAAHAVEMRAEIAQAVTDGTITQENADWLLEGLDKGFIHGHGFGFGFGKHGQPPAQTSTTS